MGKKVRQRVQLELDRFLDPRWIVFGTPPEAFQKSEAIQGDPAGSRVDRFLDRFLDRMLDRRWNGHSDLHYYKLRLLFFNGTQVPRVDL